MAVRHPEATSITEPWAAPTWPKAPSTPARPRRAYNPLADELVLRFAGTAGRRSVVVPISSPDDQDVNVMADEETGEVVGVQVDNLLFSVAAEHPTWRALAEPDPPAAVVADVLAEARRRFERYGAGETPPAG